MTNDINLKFNAGGMEGFYSFTAINANTGLERDLGDVIAKESPNMIVDSGLERLGATAESLIYMCAVGTSSTAVTASQTALINQIATTTTSQASNFGAQSTAPYFWWYRRTFRFGQGVAAGNLTEVGIKTSGSGNPLFSRALIVDSQGNPTTLTILSDEYLDITYEFRVYPNTSDVNTTITLMGTNYNVTIRPSNVNSNSGMLNNGYLQYGIRQGWSSDMSFRSGEIASITSNPTGSVYSHSLAMANYIPNSKEGTFIFTAGLNDANFTGGISSLWLGTNKGSFQVGFTPAIPKDNFTTLVLNLTLGWDRYAP